MLSMSPRLKRSLRAANPRFVAVPPLCVGTVLPLWLALPVEGAEAHQYGSCCAGSSTFTRHRAMFKTPEGIEEVLERIELINGRGI